MCLFVPKIRPFEPSVEYLSWVSHQNSLWDIQKFMLEWEWVSDKDLFGRWEYWDTPTECFINKKSDCDAIHWLLADATWRRLGHTTYVLTAWNFAVKFPFVEGHAMMIDVDTAGNIKLVNYWDMIPMTKLFDLEAVKLAGYSHIGAIYSIPDGKKIRR